MGIREKINENPKPYMIGAIAFIVVGVALGVLLTRRSAPNEMTPVDRFFYTDDDGKTFFPEARAKLGTDFKGPNGGEAVWAHVFQFPNDPKEKRFVVWMEKFTPEGKQKLAEFYANPSNKSQWPPEELNAERFVKRPGGEWLAPEDAGAAQIRQIEPRGQLVAGQVFPDN